MTPTDYTARQLATFTSSQQTIFITQDPYSGKPSIASVQRRTGPGYHGTVGAALARQEYASMLETFRALAPRWGCGYQDHYGELMAEVLAEIRECGYHGPIETIWGVSR